MEPTSAKVRLSLQLWVVLLLVACVPNPEGATRDRTLTVFAAASLTDAVTEIGGVLQGRTPGVTVTYNYAGSSTLAAQLVEGAQADVFLSADEAQMQSVQEAGLLASAPVVFAANRLVVAVPAQNPAGIDALENLTADGIMIVTAAEGVPIRTYTEAMLQALVADGYDVSALRANVVSEETNVRQVVAKLALGEADAAIVYASDVTPQLAADVTALDIIPERANVTATYPAAALNNGQTELAGDFIAYLQSDEAQSILAEWGFLTVTE